MNHSPSWAPELELLRYSQYFCGCQVKETPRRKWNGKITTGNARPQDRLNTHQSGKACQQFPFNEHYRFRRDSNFPLYLFIIYMEQD